MNYPLNQVPLDLVIETPRAKRYKLMRSTLVEGVELKQVLGDSKKPAVVGVRWKIWFIMNVIWGYPFNRIGDIWGTDHTTIRYGVLNYIKQRDFDDRPIQDSTDPAHFTTGYGPTPIRLHETSGT